MGAGTSKPISLAGVNWIETFSIIIGTLALIGSVLAIVFLARKSGPVGMAGLTENSFLSKAVEFGTTLLVSYLPLALLWLGPMLSVLLIKTYFMIPTLGAIITFLAIGAAEKLIFDVGKTTLGQL